MTDVVDQKAACAFLQNPIYVDFEVLLHTAENKIGVTGTAAPEASNSDWHYINNTCNYR